MTRTEYNALYAEAKRTYPSIVRKALNEMKTIYEDAAKNVAKRIALAELKGEAEVTRSLYKQVLDLINKSKKTITDQLILESSIDNAIYYAIDDFASIDDYILSQGLRISQKLNNLVPKTVIEGSKLSQVIHEDYMVNAFRATGSAISQAGISNMFIAINDKLIANIAGRIFQDGYNYSTRVWRVARAFQDDIKRITLSGLVQNRDILEIAKDINVYANKGFTGVIQRYGKLIRGTAAFRKRIRGTIYYPSLRILRSELYAGLQDNARYMGQINPAALPEYDWIRNTNENWGCACPGYAANSPYTLDALPSYPHPNCLCIIRPRLRDSRQFFADLKVWTQGTRVDYIDNWYARYYIPAAA